MTWIEGISATTAGLKLLDLANKNGLLQSWFSKKNKKILLLGCSGSGKTQLTYSLSTNNQYKIVTARTQVNNPLEGILEKLPIEIIDTAGDISKIKSKEQKNKINELFNLQNLDSFAGVINLVSYGYTQIENNEKYVIQTNENQKYGVNEAFLQSQRELEISHLDEWLYLLPQIKDKWIITLVNKADVWKEEDEKVKDYYENEANPYKQKFKAKFEEIGFEVPHIILPYSAILELFYNKISLKIGMTKQLELKANFLTHLTQLLGKKQKL